MPCLSLDRFYRTNGRVASEQRAVASEKVAGILAAIAVFTVTSVLVFAFGAPWFFVVIAIILSLLVGRLIAQQPWKFEE